MGVNLKLGWVPELLINAFLCGLVIRQVFVINTARLEDLRLNNGRLGMIMVLMRDSVVYFIVYVSELVFNLIKLIAAGIGSVLPTLLVPFSWLLLG